MINDLLEKIKARAAIAARALRRGELSVSAAYRITSGSVIKGMRVPSI